MRLTFCDCCKSTYILIFLNSRLKQEIEDELIKEAQADHSKYDCFVVVLLSHGHRGVVFGKDGNLDENNNPVSGFISIDRITKLIGNAESLYGRPKLFFVQACQGGK